MNTHFPLAKMAILGPGLIGGSILLACLERKLSQEIAVWGSDDQALEGVRQRGLPCSLHLSVSEAIKGAELVLVCVPIGVMAAVITPGLGDLLPSAVVTDVGSVKTAPNQEMEKLLSPHARWIGSHPMAGRELAGFAAARADLFQGAATIITPTVSTHSQAVWLARSFWEALGGRVLELSPEEHDRLVAEISHMPHVVAAALTQAVSAASLDLVGSGFRDTTRIASGPAEMWQEILLANHVEVGRSLDAVLAILQETRKALEAKDAVRIGKLLRQANEARERIVKP